MYKNYHNLYKKYHNLYAMLFIIECVFICRHLKSKIDLNQNHVVISLVVFVSNSKIDLIYNYYQISMFKMLGANFRDEEFTTVVIAVLPFILSSFMTCYQIIN